MDHSVIPHSLIVANVVSCRGVGLSSREMRS